MAFYFFVLPFNFFENLISVLGAEQSDKPDFMTQDHGPEI